jgi:hypothetical protein
MVNYKNSKIYRIYDNETGKCYYGSTCNTLERRLCQHEKGFKSYLNGNHGYVSSFEIIEKNNYNISLVENCDFNSRKQLRQRERFYIENNECVNQVIPCRTSKEYFQKNKSHIYEKHREWCKNNNQKLLEKKRQFNNQRCICEICGTEVNRGNLLRHKKSKKCLEHNNIINI